MIINVQRTVKSEDGLFGILTIKDNPFRCYTCENLEKSIPKGEYKMDFTYSKRFQRMMPHIIVPERDEKAGGDAGIRIHSANFPKQLEGCIAVGNKIGDNMVADSRDTFVKLMKVIQNEKEHTIIIRSIEEDWDV